MKKLLILVTLLCLTLVVHAEVLVIQNMEQLEKTIPTSTDAYAELLGYYSPGDGGGGSFFWDATSDEDGNTGTIIAPSQYSNGRWKRILSSGVIDVKWFGAKGYLCKVKNEDGSEEVYDDSEHIQAAIDAVNKLDEFQKPAVKIPEGIYYISNTITVPSNITIVGTAKDIGYTYGFSHSSEIRASKEVKGAVFEILGNNTVIKNLSIYGQNVVEYGIYTSGKHDRLSSNTIENVAITLFLKSGIYLNNMGITKIRNVQISNCLEAGIDVSGWGDADIEGVYINSINADSESHENKPSSVPTYGVGIRLRASVIDTSEYKEYNPTANLNIRGGKIEWCRIGILINNGNGINISAVNFDNCRKSSIYIESDEHLGDNMSYSKSTNSSIQITGCRFLGGDMKSQEESSHIYAALSRHITITGNGFKRANNGAGDFIDWGDSKIGPKYGIYLDNSEQCTIVGNDLYGAAAEHCLKIEHNNPDIAQHTIEGNNLDGTEQVNVAIKNTPSFGNINFLHGKTPNAINTSKAWVRFNGNSDPVEIKSSYNIKKVIKHDTDPGTYYVHFKLPMNNKDYSVNVSARNWFGPTDSANYGETQAEYVQVFTTSNGQLSNNGDVTVIIHGY